MESSFLLRRGGFGVFCLTIAASCFSVNATSTPCPAYEVPTAIGNAVTGEFSGMFPSEYGDLLFCGISVQSSAASPFKV
jgi:hypothetical protein